VSAADAPLWPPVRSTARAGHNFGRVAVGSPAAHRVQRKRISSESSDGNDGQAGHFAEPIIGSDGSELAHRESAGPASRVAHSLVQRAAMPGAAPGPAAASPGAVTPAAPGPSTSQQTATRPLIVEDDADQADPDQMRKGTFLDRLQSSVCAAADAELARVGRNTQGCPYIEGWIGHYRRTSAQYLERALRRYAPEAASARTAADYIPAVTERVR